MPIPLAQVGDTLTVTKSMITCYGIGDDLINQPYACPQKFKLQYLDRIKPDKPISDNLVKGSAFHNYAEKYFDSKRKGEVLKIPADARNTDIKNFDNFNAGREVSIKKESPDKYEDVFYPLASEKYIEVSDLKIKGIIDAVFIHSDGELILAEWKTGRDRSKDPYMIHELHWYKMLWDEAGQQPIKYLATYFVSANKTLFMEADPQIMLEVKENLQSFREKVNAGIFPKRADQNCTKCEFFGEYCSGRND